MFLYVCGMTINHDRVLNIGKYKKNKNKNKIKKIKIKIL